jgi:hypothetical protein
VVDFFKRKKVPKKERHTTLQPKKITALLSICFPVEDDDIGGRGCGGRGGETRLVFEMQETGS